ncbi:MAG: DUF4105 domain-containing protein [Pyrinomonadaceae bacterium]
MRKISFTLVLLLVLIPVSARADVSLLLGEAIGYSGEWTGSGHTAIYFSNICSDGPVKLRLCAPEERGVVISSYPNFGEHAPYQWIAVPVIPYLYGVESERDIPLYANGEVRTLLRETYRQKHLRSIVPDTTDGSIPKGQWRPMIGSVLNRDVYSFNVKTTPEEDARLVREFNELPNKRRFGTLYDNCADFARIALNRYFPGATHRDVLNDFTLSTTPKAVAKSLTGYATKRPERLFNITMYPQVSGTIWRSFDVRNLTELGFLSRKYYVPSLIFNPYVAAIFGVTYLTTGRFSVHKTYKKYAAPEIAQLNLDKHLLKRQAKEPRGETAKLGNGFGSDAGRSSLTLNEIAERQAAERLRLFGDKQTWSHYKAAFAPRLAAAIDLGLFLDRDEVKTFFRDLELQSEPAFDENGALILKVKAYGQDRILGLTRDNIIGENSDPQLAYKLMLAKINVELKANEKNRESLETFKSDWALLTRLAANFAASPEALKSSLKGRTRFLQVPVRTSFKHRLKKLIVHITH